MYKKLPHYDNVFINTENEKLYRLQDGEMVELYIEHAIIYQHGQDTENRKTILDQGSEDKSQQGG